MNRFKKSSIYLVLIGFSYGLLGLWIRGEAIVSAKDWVRLIVLTVGCLISGWYAVVVAREQFLLLGRHKLSRKYGFRLSNGQRWTLFPICGAGPSSVFYNIKRKDEWIAEVVVNAETLGSSTPERFKLGFPYGTEEIRIDISADKAWQTGLRISIDSSEPCEMFGTVYVSVVGKRSTPNLPESAQVVAGRSVDSSVLTLDDLG